MLQPFLVCESYLLQTKVATTLIPGCIKQWGLKTQFVMTVSYHLSCTKFFFMSIQGYFKQFLIHFVI